MGNLCFPGYDNDDHAETDELILRATRKSREHETAKTDVEKLNEVYREVEKKSDRDIDEMDRKVDETTEKLSKLRERMRALLKDRDPEDVEPEEFIRMQVTWLAN